MADIAILEAQSGEQARGTTYSLVAVDFQQTLVAGGDFVRIVAYLRLRKSRLYLAKFMISIDNIFDCGLIRQIGFLGNLGDDPVARHTEFSLIDTEVTTNQTKQR